MFYQRQSCEAFNVRLLRLFVCIPLLLGTSCTSCTNTEPPDWPEPIVKEVATGEAADTTNQLVVYLDTSASMAGYISPNNGVSFAAASNGQTIFSQLLLELRHVVTTLTPSVNVVFRKVASDVSPPSFNDLELSQASINRTVYNGKETDLAGAIKKYSEPLSSKSELQEKQQQPFPRFHILVTDGVQSTKGQRTNLSCDKGSDYFCVKKQIVQLLESGWQGTVLGIKSEFNGTVYSEIQTGLKVQYASTPNDVKTYRPFYVYVFSLDKVGLNKLVETLKARLQPLLGNRDAIREYPFTLALAEGVAKGEIKLTDKSKNYLESTVFKGKDNGPSRYELLADLNTQRANVGMQTFSFKIDLPWTGHALDAGTPEQLSRLLRWELLEVKDEKNPEQSSYRYPELKLVTPQTNEHGELELSAGWPERAGTPGWRMYRLVARLNTEIDGPPWVSQWSTSLDTKPEHATRTVNLEDALSKLWKNSVMESVIIAEYHIRLGKN